MESFVLLERSGLHHVTPGGVSSVSEGVGPLLVGPSLTFRKHFQVPRSVERERSRVFLEMFSNAVPARLHDFHHQFLITGSTEEHWTVLGLAVKRDRLNRALDRFEASPDVYFFERLLAEGPDASPTLIEIPLPEGRYLAVLEDSLAWSRYLANPDERTRRECLETVTRTFPDLQVREPLPDFPSGDSHTPAWSRGVLSLLPESLQPSWKVINARADTPWNRYRSRAWALLILIFLSLVSWILLQQYAERRYRGWIEGEFQRLFDRASSYPLEEVQNRIARLEQAENQREQPVLLTYPRVVAIDAALQNHRVKVLRLALSREGGRMIFLVPSLEEAESFLESVQNHEFLQSAAIESTDSTSHGDYTFEVSARVRWSQRT